MSRPAKERSDQGRRLNRLLTLQLIRDLAIYSVLFIAAALLLNAFAVPRLANLIADSTSEWTVYPYEDMPLDECLAVLGGRIYGAASSWEDPRIQSDGSMDLDAISDEQLLFSLQKDKGALSASALGLTPLSREELKALPIDSDATALLFAQGDEVPRWTAFASIQRLAAEALFSSLAADDSMQVLFGEEAVEVRNLSFYSSLRSLKVPLAVILYLAGFILLAFVGFRRALGCFDELAGAVGSILTDREKPVSLSAPLRDTQDELNGLRLASLADERAAQAAERRKDELVAYLAHDVKTPLTSVIGYLSLLSEAPDMPEEARCRYTQTALRKAERLEELTDEFFEITRYNLQAIPIERANVAMGLLCQQVAEEFYPQAAERDVTLQVQAPEEGGAFVDPDKFARALGNVIRNAVAYADPHSAVEVIAQPGEAGEGKPAAEGVGASGWTVVVRNHGREISEAHLQSIFERFFREDGARSSSSGRSGLGLAIAKEIMVAHGGAITAQSQDGVTEFTLTVP